jgi:hypothetical protein
MYVGLRRQGKLYTFGNKYHRSATLSEYSLLPLVSVRKLDTFGSDRSATLSVHCHYNIYLFLDDTFSNVTDGMQITESVRHLLRKVHDIFA